MLPDVFYILCYTGSIVISLIGIVVSVFILFIIATNQTLHSPRNLLLCDTALSTIFGLVNDFISSFYGFREHWAINQPLCIARGYFFTTSGYAVSLSYFLQASDRLFSTVFHNKRSLSTYRVYISGIVCKWLISLSFSAIPLFFNETYIYERESRLCILNSKNFLSAGITMVVGFAIPFTIDILMYMKIFFYARAAHRATSMESHLGNPFLHNLKREKRIARNMIIILLVYAIGGTPYLSIIFWQHFVRNINVPEPLYFFATKAIIVGMSGKMIVLIFLNKQVKDTLRNVLFLRVTVRVGCEGQSVQKLPRRVSIRLQGGGGLVSLT